MSCKNIRRHRITWHKTSSSNDDVIIAVPFFLYFARPAVTNDENFLKAIGVTVTLQDFNLVPVEEKVDFF